MDFNKLFKKINKSSNFLIVSNNLKDNIIKLKTSYEIKHKLLLDFKILSEGELINSLSFDASNELYLHNLCFNKTPVSITKDLLKFSKYNFLKKNKELSEFYNKNKKFLITNEHFIKNIKNYHFYILGSSIYLKPFIDYYKLKVDTIEIEHNKNKPIIKKFITKEEEVFYLFEEISRLLDKGININDIYIANIDKSYNSYLIKFSKFYKLPINLDLKVSLLNIPYIKTLMTYNYNDLIELLSNKELLNKEFYNIREIDVKLFDENINKLINIFNKYPHKNYKSSAVMELIKLDVKNTNIKSTETISDALSIINIEDVIALGDNKKIFILNAVYESFPKILKDNEYLSDKERSLINYPVSTNINISNNNYLEEIVYKDNIKYISYPLRDNYNEFTKSDLAGKLETSNEPIEITLKDIKKGYALDYYKSYFTSNNNNDVLQTTFKGNFKLTNREREKIKETLKQKDIKISPSQVQSYYQIPFIYYLERIIGLNTFSESINLKLGNFFHSLIEILMLLYFEEKVNMKDRFAYDDDTHKRIFNYIVEKGMNLNLEKEIDYNKFYDEYYEVYFFNEIREMPNHYNKELDDTARLNIKTLFYTKKHKKTIIESLKFIIDLEEQTPSDELLLEKSVELDNFRGQADLVKKYNNKTYSIIDYKTSNKPAFNKDKIMELINSLISDSELLEIDFDALSLLQLVLYAYFFYKEDASYKLKDLAYFSYLEDKKQLNGMTTNNSFDSYHYNKGRGDGRFIDKEVLEKLFDDIDLLIDKTLEKIKNVEFPVNVRLNSKDKTGMDKSYYSVYEALAFFDDQKKEDVSK